MKMKGRKATVFFINTIILVGLFILLVFQAPGILGAGIGQTIIISIILNGGAFIGGNSFDKYTISKYYKAELNENNKQNKTGN